jgi:hypothetical protein
MGLTEQALSVWGQKSNTTFGNSLLTPHITYYNAVLVPFFCIKQVASFIFQNLVFNIQLLRVYRSVACNVHGTAL